MRGGQSPVLMLAAAAAAAAMSWPAGAQCRLCDKPSTIPDAGGVASEVQLQIETTLDFDRLILAGSGAGDATMRPDGSSAATGSVTDLGPRARVATVVIHGQPGRLIRIDVPRSIELYSLEGGRLTFDEVVTDAADLPKLDSAGNLTFHIGGRLRFTGGEDGDFRGDLPISVDYQ